MVGAGSNHALVKWGHSLFSSRPDVIGTFELLTSPTSGPAENLGLSGSWIQSPAGWHLLQRPQELAPHIRRLSITLGQCLTHQCVTINPRHPSVGWHQLGTPVTGNCQKGVIPTSSLILALGSTAPWHLPLEPALRVEQPDQEQDSGHAAGMPRLSFALQQSLH